MENRIKELERINGEQNLKLCIDNEKFQNMNDKLDLMVKNMDDKFDIVLTRIYKLEQQLIHDREEDKEERESYRVEMEAKFQDQDKKYWYYIAFITSLLATLIAIFRI